jgi:PilZ domain
MVTLPAQPEDAPRRPGSAQALSAERRASKRLPARSSVVIEVRKGTLSLGPNLAVNLLDLSVEGAGVLMSGKLKVGEQVEILLWGHGIRSKLKRLAKVRWVTKLEPDHFVMGFKFETPIPDTELNSFVRPDSTELHSSGW